MKTIYVEWTKEISGTQKINVPDDFNIKNERSIISYIDFWNSDDEDITIDYIEDVTLKTEEQLEQEAEFNRMKADAEISIPLFEEETA